MADATDLKSVGRNSPCRFESGHRHPLKPPFSQVTLTQSSVLVIAQQYAKKHTETQSIRQLFVNLSRMRNSSDSDRCDNLDRSLPVKMFRLGPLWRRHLL